MATYFILTSPELRGFAGLEIIFRFSIPLLSLSLSLDLSWILLHLVQ
jgi:hypothetical protein